MATNYTRFDAANSAVRSFLTTIGNSFLENEPDLKKFFKEKKGVSFWSSIKEEFDHCCAYCGIKEGTSILNKRGKKVNVRLEREHLLMFNKEECGLHHPGNIVPSCSPCNVNNRKDGWKKHLYKICNENESLYFERLSKIENHIKKYKYPDISIDLQDDIKFSCVKLYNNVVNTVLEIESDFLHRLNNIK